MKNLTLVGKINSVLGVIFFLSGVVMLIMENSKGFSWNDLPQSITFILIGIAIFVSAGLYRKEQS